jgi:hypothetical protein
LRKKKNYLRAARPIFSSPFDKSIEKKTRTASSSDRIVEDREKKNKKKTKKTMDATQSLIRLFFLILFWIRFGIDYLLFTIRGSKKTFSQPILAPSLKWSSWQHPELQKNKYGSNIHADAYRSDVHTVDGPTLENELQKVALFTTANVDGKQKRIGECAAFVWTRVDGIDYVLTVSNEFLVLAYKYIKDDTTLEQVAAYQMTKPESLSFATGYFYFTKNNEIVAIDGGKSLSIIEFTGKSLELSQNIDLSPVVVEEDELYATIPDKCGNPWFASQNAVVGFVDMKTDKIHIYDINEHTEETENVTASISVDEGDAEEKPSGIYVVTTHRIYRFGTDKSKGKPKVVIEWAKKYNRGSYRKPGQTSQGCGTSPTLFSIQDAQGKRHRFVAICDNATVGMNMNVYRAEVELLKGKKRLARQVKPFGLDILVSCENSLIAHPIVNDDHQQIGAALIVENNYGVGPFALPGFARVDFTLAGMAVTSVNENISIPTVVSKSNSKTGLVYTYERRFPEDWHLTALSVENLNRVNFSYLIGKGTRFNNTYASLALGPKKDILIGTILGFIFCSFEKEKKLENGKEEISEDKEEELKEQKKSKEEDGEEDDEEEGSEGKESAIVKLTSNQE